MKKLCCLMLAGVMCLSMLSGCGGKANTSSLTAEEEENLPKLKVMFLGEEIGVDEIEHEMSGSFMSKYAKDIVEWYNYVAPESQEVEVYQEQLTLSKAESQQETLLNFLTQEPPDLYFFQTDDMGVFNTLLSQGGFADLNPMLQKDESINLDDYNQDVMNLGVQGKKRYFIPMCYRIMTIMTTDEILQENEISLPDGFSLKNIGKYSQNVKDSNTPVIFPKAYRTLFQQYLYDKFIDHNAKVTTFNSSEFKEAMRDYQIASSKKFEITDKTQSIFSIPLFGFVGSIATTFSKLNKDHQQPRVYALKDPSNSNGYSAYAKSVVAIAKNCKRSQDAYQFISFLMSPNIQKGDKDLQLRLYGNPIYKPAQQEQVQQIEKDYYLDDNPEWSSVKQEYFEIINNITNYTMFTNERLFQKIFDPLYAEYEKGNLSLDSFCSQLDNKVSIFLKE